MIVQVGDMDWGCSSVGRASDRHIADTGSIPRCGKGFFSLPESIFSADSFGVCTPPCAIACIYICAHGKDPVVRVRLGSATLSQLAFPGEGNPSFPWEKFYWDYTIVNFFLKANPVMVRSCISRLRSLGQTPALSCLANFP